MKEGIVRKYQIQMLADLTAEVFRMPKKRVRTLENYARLTKEAMAFGVADPSLIYERSYLVGERLRHAAADRRRKRQPAQRQAAREPIMR